ncbi:hypothetical protein N9H37_02435 [Congregibacter sp.]|nr:hypothetical protein [Congregibacter sp.]MDA8962191.1 hypothetical protein [Congregibacter sp.]
MYKKIGLGACLLLTLSQGALAQDEQVIEVVPLTVSVENRTEDNGSRQRFTGCLAGLPAGTVSLAGCNPDFIMFGCDGSAGISKSAANIAFNNANLAFVAELPLKARVTRLVNADGLCLAVNSQVTRLP